MTFDKVSSLSFYELMSFIDERRKSTKIEFTKVLPGIPILLHKVNRNHQDEFFIAKTVGMRKSGAYVISIEVSRYIFDGAEKSIKPGTKFEFRNSSSISIYGLTDSTVKDAHDILVAQRKAYAEARKMLQQGRQTQADAFTLLHMDNSITMEEFRVRRKKIMLKFHEDRWQLSGLPQDVFMDKAKKVSDALAFVENFIKSRDSRSKI